MSADAARPYIAIPPMPRWAIAAALAVGAWFLGTHFLHAFTEAINWDEFALLERADRTLRFDRVTGSGRPGLVPIALMPFVMDCVDSVKSVVNARLLWQFITLAYLTGVYFMVRRWFVHAGRDREGRVQGLLAVVLLAFLPAFVTWSVQVRTDQAALAAAVWGGVLLLSTSYRRAAVAGALFAVALLCTQKGAYAIALCGVLFATASAERVWATSSTNRVELTLAFGRLAVSGAALILVLGGYALLVPESAQLASGGAFASGIETMDWTRARQGYRIYTVHAYRLVVHWVLFGILILWSLRVIWTRDRSELLLVATCWLALLLGLAVIRFHGSSFPYFIMTAGLFPALALAMASARPLAMTGRMAWPVIMSLVALAAFQSMPEVIEMLDDTQWEQRATMRLVYASPLRDRRGYQVEGALFCTRDPSPLPAMFSQVIWRKFRASPQASKNTADFISELRDRPVAYFVESYRMNQFPDEIRRFFAEHYVWYARSLFIAGFQIEGTAAVREIDVIVPGSYRWMPDPNSPEASIRVGRNMLQPFEIADLETGKHSAEIQMPISGGALMLADLPPPIRDAYPAFYLRRQIAQLGGHR